jgi:hypothetical protein
MTSVLVPVGETMQAVFLQAEIAARGATREVLRRVGRDLEQLWPDGHQLRGRLLEDPDGAWHGPFAVVEVRADDLAALARECRRGHGFDAVASVAALLTVAPEVTAEVCDLVREGGEVVRIDVRQFTMYQRCALVMAEALAGPSFASYAVAFRSGRPGDGTDVSRRDVGSGYHEVLVDGIVVGTTIRPPGRETWGSVGAAGGSADHPDQEAAEAVQVRAFLGDPLNVARALLRRDAGLDGGHR